MSTKKKRNYTTVSIPLALMKRVDHIIEEMGYRNRSDFILEAIRRRLDELKIERVETIKSP